MIVIRSTCEYWISKKVNPYNENIYCNDPIDVWWFGEGEGQESWLTGYCHKHRKEKPCSDDDQSGWTWRKISVTEADIVRIMES